MSKRHKQPEHEHGGSEPQKGGSRKTWIAFCGGVLAVVVFSFVAGLIVVYNGLYGVAATEEHRPSVRWALDTNYHRAVERAAADLMAPADLGPAALEQGAQLYKQTCQHCHGGAGVERSQWALGMRPTPPELVHAATEWELEEVFWLAKHGVRMTGMPAFGSFHEDEVLWSVAAFVKELPAMTPEQYAGQGAPITPATEQ